VLAKKDFILAYGGKRSWAAKLRFEGTRALRVMGRPLARIAALLVLPALGVVTAFGIAPGTTQELLAGATTVQKNLPLPDFDADELNLPAHANEFTYSEKVLRGDTLAALFSRLAINDVAAAAFVRNEKAARPLLNLVPGRTLQSRVDAEGKLISLRYFNGSSSVFELARAGESFAATERTVTGSARTSQRSGTVSFSLFGATDAARVPDSVAIGLARIFGTQINFHTDLRKGDKFAVTYEELYENGEYLGPGRILAAEFVNKGVTITAILFKDEDGHDAYFGHDGQNLARGFLRSPVEFSRVSSGFGGRTHPILKQWRQHTGVDFAAPKGTRVLAAAEGQVIFHGWKNGYGNTLEIKHGSEITTLYAHLSGFADGSAVGSRVRQGQVIGFVGATGWATGPHLHYEFKVAGAHQDPLTVELPRAAPVAASQKLQFAQTAAQSKHQLAKAHEHKPARFE
jgi:murein DD-endopeptidase MepM/ murein hydrolase activator NlpD